MASRSHPASTLTELQPPGSVGAIERTFEGYRAWLRTATPDQLREQLTKINAALEEQSRTTLQSMVERSGGLSDYLTSLDRVQLRSTPPDLPSSHSPRGRGAQGSPRSRPPSPLDLLAGSGRLGPRLAAKLVAASARASRRRDG